jgi:hypothetical protein
LQGILQDASLPHKPAGTRLLPIKGSWLPTYHQ